MVDLNEIQEIIRTECDINSKISGDSKLSEILDSISMLTLVTQIENKYEIEIDDSMLETPPETVNELISLLNTFIQENK